MPSRNAMVNPCHMGGALHPPLDNGNGACRIWQLRLSRNMKNDRELDIFRKYLERRGLKLTAERQALFDELFARHEHLEADELLVRLRANHKKISRATIYRTLDLLADSGIVGKVRISEAGYRYERLRAGDHHDHLICKECGRVVEFYEQRIEELQDEVCERYGFILLDHSHQMRGICRQCRPRHKAVEGRERVDEDSSRGVVRTHPARAARVHSER